MNRADHRFDWLSKSLESLAGRGQLRRLHVRDATGQAMMIQTERGPLVNFGSNDYLGLASESGAMRGPSPGGEHDEPWARGSGASALLTGHSSPLDQLQTLLAQWESTQAAVVLPSGFAANISVISCLAQAGDLILSDANNHASIIDGCRLSKAQRFIYPHADAQAVEVLLRAHRDRFERAFIVTDSVFSMDGDFAPLDRLCDLAEEHDAILIVDEAHATGVWGESGSGLCEHLGVKQRVPIRVGTLSKAIGAMGGFVCGPQVVIDYLINHGRSLIYSTALPPMVAATALAHVRLMIDQPQRRQQLHANVERLRGGLDAFWQRRVASSCSQIIPLVMGENQAALDLQDDLAQAGFFVPAIRPPTVPARRARVRISVSASHTDDQIDGLAAALNQYASQADKTRRSS